MSLQYRVNVLGIIYSVTEFLPLLRKGSTKRIMVVTSSAGNPDLAVAMGVTGMVAYSATRSASNMVIANYGKLLEPEGFVLAGVSPGPTDTSETAESAGKCKRLVCLVHSC